MTYILSNRRIKCKCVKIQMQMGSVKYFSQNGLQALA